MYFRTRILWLRMKPLINFKQLYFLLFILAAYGIIALMRTSSEDEVEFPANWYRSPTPVWSERSICQVECLGISDSNVALIFRHGQLVSSDGGNAILEGRTFSNDLLKLYLGFRDERSFLDSLHMAGESDSCPCPLN